jgi:flagellar hook-basal body complex protein FliE
MAINNIALQAYQNAMQAEQAAKPTASAKHFETGTKSFSSTMKESLTKVNDMQAEKKSMIESFASGETQNVHELMITMQKAGIAMRMTSAVRNKVMESYKELMRTQF